MESKSETETVDPKASDLFKASPLSNETPHVIVIKIVDDNRAFRFGACENIVWCEDRIPINFAGRVPTGVQDFASPLRARCYHRVITSEIDDILCG